MPESVIRTLEKLTRNFAWRGGDVPTVAMAHMSNDMDQGGKRVLDLSTRSEAIQLTRVQTYLKMGEERTTWAYTADEILANDVPGELESLEE